MSYWSYTQLSPYSSYGLSLKYPNFPTKPNHPAICTIPTLEMVSTEGCDEEAVSRILSCKCYYSILGVDKDASSARIRQTYRQLALNFHPDKNKSPGAVEAFQAIGNAYEVLSDREKKKQYDMSGQEDRLTGARSRHAHRQENQDPEEEVCKGAYGRRQFYYSRKYGG